MARKTAKEKRRAQIEAHGGDIAWRQKAGRWGHEKGWTWVSLERFESTCTHARRIVQRIFHGRRIKALVCTPCRQRVMLRRADRGRPATAPIVPDVVIKVEKTEKRIW